MEWVSRKKKLPEEWTEIIMYFPEYHEVKDFMQMTLYCKAMKDWPFTHWAPKPKPPEK
jgi:hypothetical protein